METSEILYPHPLFYFFCFHRVSFNQKMSRTSDDGDADSDDRYGRAVATSR